jgi:hypothetical protein
LSVLRQMPPWCWHHSTSGAAGQRTMQCGSWTFGLSAISDGMKLARMPRVVLAQVSPPSRVVQAPPQLRREVHAGHGPIMAPPRRA